MHQKEQRGQLLSISTLEDFNTLIFVISCLAPINLENTARLPSAFPMPPYAKRTKHIMGMISEPLLELSPQSHDNCQAIFRTLKVYVRIGTYFHGSLYS